MGLARHSSPVARAAAWLAVLAGLTLAAAPAVAQQSPTARLKVDRRVATVDDEVSVELEMQGSFDSYQEPSMEGFQVTMRRPTTQVSIINGRVSRSQSIMYRLSPQRTGTLTIGSALLLDNGRVVARTEPVKVRVKEASVPNPLSADKARDVDAIARSSRYFVHASTDRDTYYLGEPFVITWSVYTPSDMMIDPTVEVVSSPNLDGLLVRELEDPQRRLRSRMKRLGGRLMRETVLSRQLAVPLKTGRVLIDTMTLRMTAGAMFRSQRHVLRSQPFYLDVKPLPPGAPDGFEDGQVGHFELDVKLRDADGRVPTRLRTGERVVLTAVVKGDGNLVGVKAPQVDASGKWEVQPLPKTGDDGVEQDGSGMHGSRVFEYVVAPLAPGKLTTPTVRFVSFDPDKGEYVTAEEKGRPVQVEGPTLGTSKSGDAAYEGEDIAPIVEGEKLEAHSRETFAGSELFWALFVAPFLLFVGIEARHRVQVRLAKDPTARRARGASGNARKRLAAAEQALKDGLVKDFYGQIARTLMHYMEERANIPAVGMTHDELREAASAAGYEPALVERVVEELEHCDFARFAPAAEADREMRATLGRARDLIGDLDQVKPARRA